MPGLTYRPNSKIMKIGEIRKSQEPQSSIMSKCSLYCNGGLLMSYDIRQYCRSLYLLYLLTRMCTQWSDLHCCGVGFSWGKSETQSPPIMRGCQVLHCAKVHVCIMHVTCWKAEMQSGFACYLHCRFEAKYV